MIHLAIVSTRRVQQAKSMLLLFSIASPGIGCSNSPEVCNLALSPIKAQVLHGDNCAYPGLVALPNGSLLVAYACPIQTIQTSISSDGGTTWTFGSTIQFNGSVDSLSLLPDGEVFLSTSYNPVSGIGVPTYFLGRIQQNGSITWGSPNVVHTPAWSRGCWAVSPLVSAGPNRLLWPVWCNSNKLNDQLGSSTVLVSVNGGKSWDKQVTVADGDADRRDYDESAGVFYPDGEIVMIIRHTDPGSSDRYGSYWYSHSLDSGASWSVPRKVADAKFVGRPSLTILKSGALVLVGRAQTRENSSTGYAVSRDRGRTFSRFADLGFDVRDTFDSYDAVTVLSDDSVGVVTIHSNPGGESNNIDYRILIDECLTRGNRIFAER